MNNRIQSDTKNWRDFIPVRKALAGIFFAADPDSYAAAILIKGSYDSRSEPNLD